MPLSSQSPLTQRGVPCHPKSASVNRCGQNHIYWVWPNGDALLICEHTAGSRGRRPRPRRHPPGSAPGMRQRHPRGDQGEAAGAWCHTPHTQRGPGPVSEASKESGPPCRGQSGPGGTWGDAELKQGTMTWAAQSLFLLQCKHMGGTWGSWPGAARDNSPGLGCGGGRGPHTQRWRVPELEPRWKQTAVDRPPASDGFVAL